MDCVSFLINDGVFMVHKGWQPRLRNTRRAQVTLLDSEVQDQASGVAFEPKEDSTWRQQFQFLNSSEPGRNRDPDARRLIRRHVRNNTILRQRASSKVNPTKYRKLLPGCQTVSKVSNIEKSGQGSCTECTVPRLFESPTALCNNSYAIEMQPRMHVLLEHFVAYVTRRSYPVNCLLSPNPFRSQHWFRTSVTDPAMLHVMLYTAATLLALLEGRTSSTDTIYHQYHTISIVQKRLNDPTFAFDDSTMGAISCLALTAAISGNQDLWHVHMRGLKQMIVARGSSDALSPVLQAKLWRSDINGAIDYVSPPYLDFQRPSGPRIWSIMPSQQLRTTEISISQILKSCSIHSKLIDTMTELSYFSQTILFARSSPTVRFDPATFSEDLYYIEHRLLSFPTIIPAASQERSIEKACRLAGLLYIKAALQEFILSKNGSSILLVQLKEALTTVWMMEAEEPLLVWVCFVGAALSKGDLRGWFVQYLAQLSACPRIFPFEDEDMEMSRLFSLKKVFGSVIGDICCESLQHWEVVQ